MPESAAILCFSEQQQTPSCICPSPSEGMCPLSRVRIGILLASQMAAPAFQHCLHYSWMTLQPAFSHTGPSFPQTPRVLGNVINHWKMTARELPVNFAHRSHLLTDCSIPRLHSRKMNESISMNLNLIFLGRQLILLFHNAVPIAYLYSTWTDSVLWDTFPILTEPPHFMVL